jgi:DNA-binding NarL/FixJ family response regulator
VTGPGVPPPPASPIRVVVGDDHPLIREALRRRLAVPEDIDLIGEASSGDELVQLIETLRGQVDVAVVDIHMPPTDGLEATETIRDRFPHLEVLILTGSEDSKAVLDGLRRGAKGYLLKHRDAAQIIEAIRLVARGTVVIDPDLVDSVARGMTADDRHSETLTARELELLQLVAVGRANVEIAATLHVSEGTVKGDLSRIIAKLHASDRTSAVAEAFRRRLIE